MKSMGAALAFVAVSTTSAGVLTSGPFSGDYSDDFNRFTSVQAEQVLPVFEQTATVSNLTTDGAIKIEISSTLGGDDVSARTGWMMGQLGIARWDFPTPAVRFGGYFENNSGADDATLVFYDENLAVIDTLVASIPAAGGTWLWHGWQSDTPFARIDVTGNGLINGFIWYEDLQVTYVPEPAAGCLFGAALVGGLRRGRRGG